MFTKNEEIFSWKTYKKKSDFIMLYLFFCQWFKVRNAITFKSANIYTLSVRH